MVEHVEHLLVTRGGTHRVVKRRDEKHQENRDHEDRNREGRPHPLRIVRVGPYGGERKGREHRERHDAVRQYVGDLLACGGDVNRFFLLHGTTDWFCVPNL